MQQGCRKHQMSAFSFCLTNIITLNSMCVSQLKCHVPVLYSKKHLITKKRGGGTTKQLPVLLKKKRSWETSLDDLIWSFHPIWCPWLNHFCTRGCDFLTLSQSLQNMCGYITCWQKRDEWGYLSCRILHAYSHTHLDSTDVGISAHS